MRSQTHRFAYTKGKRKETGSLSFLLLPSFLPSFVLSRPSVRPSVSPSPSPSVCVFFLRPCQKGTRFRLLSQYTLPLPLSSLSSLSLSPLSLFCLLSWLSCLSMCASSCSFYLALFCVAFFLFLLLQVHNNNFSTW